MTDKLTREQIDLLPCPFCGGEAELDSQRGYAQYPSGKPGSGVAIYCATCSADMHLCREDMPDISTEEMVGVLTNEWNRRAHPAAEQEGEMAGMVKTLAQSVCRDVAELPDRSSPDDWPDAMLVTHDELALIVEHYARAALSAPDVPVSGLLPCPFCGGEAHVGPTSAQMDFSISFVVVLPLDPTMPTIGMSKRRR